MRLIEEVCGLLRVGSWCQHFAITDNTYIELRLEILVTFELERGLINFHRADTVQF